MQLVVLPGDGIGPEITDATLAVLGAVVDRFDLKIEVIEDVVGHAGLERHGSTVHDGLLDLVRQADGLVLGPTATYDFDPNRGEVNPSSYFRKNLDLFANIRPSRTYPGFSGPVGDFDLIVVRENTEGFYADRNMIEGTGEMLVTNDVSIAIRKITRFACARIARVAFDLAERRSGHVSIVHKANVLRIGDGMFIEECERVAADHPDVTVDQFIVDAMMAHVVRDPRRFDVIVTTNMFGDILSDLTAELSGSLGLGGSLNASDSHAMAQASHGSAPDIAGRDLANPFSLILSLALLLSWHGRRAEIAAFEAAGAAIEAAVADAIEAHEATRDVGGTLGTRATGAELAARLHHA
jgi:3-isopropylmalate dehydrogenase